MSHFKDIVKLSNANTRKLRLELKDNNIAFVFVSNGELFVLGLPRVQHFEWDHFLFEFSYCHDKKYIKLIVTLSIPKGMSIMVLPALSLPAV